MLAGNFGPCRLEAEIGSGGMGTVWRAEMARSAFGLAPGTRVAVKVLHPHLLESPRFLPRFLREAQIGASIRQENVVRTFGVDAAESDGAPRHFLVMELVDGQTLRSLHAELGRLPEKLCRHVGREAARGLAAIHAAGVVHRDVKPDNVLITRDYVVKVMDLGVARLVDESVRLSETGVFVGSVQYAAPEQFALRGAAPDDADAVVDHRADLHALGLVLYELATSLHPYHADSFAAVMRRVLDEAPRRPAEINPQLSPFFEEFVLQLLAKDRGRRIASAAEAAQILDEGEQSAWWKTRAGRIRMETKRPLRRVRVPRETALYGREDELARLAAAFARADAGDGQVVLVEGEAGIGKSRLISDFADSLHQQGREINFLFGSYPPGGAATASSAFSTAYLEQFGASDLDGTLKDYLAVTPTLVPAFAALLRGETTPTGVEPLTKESLQTVFVHATRALAKERTTIVLIDDLHFAPEEGRGLFAALAMATPGHRVMLVGTTRPGLDGNWKSGLDRAGATRIALSRLGAKDLVRLLADTLKSSHLAEELSGRIAVKSDGNPFFVFEILRGLREGLFLARKDDGTWATTRVIADIRIPSTIRDLVNARVADLAEEERDLLDVAACCGFEFDPALVGEVCGIGTIPALKRFAQIERKHRLVRSLGRDYAFDHHQVQEALYAALNERLREHHHGAIADALERARVAGDAAPDGAVCVQLAEHLLKGAQGANAMRYLDPALSHLEKGYFNEAAILLAGRALAAPGLVAGRARSLLLLRKAARLGLLGRRDAERAALEEALALADADGDAALRSQVRNPLGVNLWRVSRNDEALVVLCEALDLARAAGDRRFELHAEGDLGSVYQSVGRLAEAQTHYERCIALANEIGDRRRTASATGNLGSAYLKLGRFAQARAQFERHIELAREFGDRRGEAVATGNLGAVLHYLGRLAQAREHHERRLVIARETGDRLGESVAVGNLGGVFQALGEFAAAREDYERWLALAQEIGDRQGEARAAGAMGEVLHALGRFADALRHHERQLALARETGDRLSAALAMGNAALASLALGRTADARTANEQALALVQEIGDRRGEGYWLHGRALVADEEGRVADAEASWRAAIAVRDEIGYVRGAADSRVALGALLARADRADDARDLLVAAHAMALESDMAGTQVAALAHLATLPRGDVAAAEDALARLGPRLDMETRMSARLALLRATGARVHADEGRRVLDEIVAANPKAERAAMLANVRLHRVIAAAAERTGR